MNRVLAFALTAAMSLFIAPAGGAHHSYAIEFDPSRNINLTGTVARIEWANPHVWFSIDVQNEATGEITSWGCEMGSPNAMIRSGWTPATLRIGLTVSLQGDRARDGSNRMKAWSVIVDGVELGSGSSRDLETF